MKKKYLLCIVVVLLIGLVVSSCASSKIKTNIEKIISLNIYGDKELKKNENGMATSEGVIIVYTGEIGRYGFDEKTGDIVFIERNQPLRSKKANKNESELVGIADKYLEKINADFYKKDYKKTLVKGKNSLKVKYQRVDKEKLLPDLCTIHLFKTGEFIRYNYDKVAADEVDVEYKITREEAIEFAKKELFKKFKIDEKTFFEKSGEVSARKAKFKGNNVWIVDLGYTDEYDKGGSYFIDSNELKLIEFMQYK